MKKVICRFVNFNHNITPGKVYDVLETDKGYMIKNDFDIHKWYKFKYFRILTQPEIISYLRDQKINKIL